MSCYHCGAADVDVDEDICMTCGTFQQQDAATVTTGEWRTLQDKTTSVVRCRRDYVQEWREKRCAIVSKIKKDHHALCEELGLDPRHVDQAFDAHVPPLDLRHVRVAYPALLVYVRGSGLRFVAKRCGLNKQTIRSVLQAMGLRLPQTVAEHLVSYCKQLDIDPDTVRIPDQAADTSTGALCALHAHGVPVDVLARKLLINEATVKGACGQKDAAQETPTVEPDQVLWDGFEKLSFGAQEAVRMWMCDRSLTAKRISQRLPTASLPTIRKALKEASHFAPAM